MSQQETTQDTGTNQAPNTIVADYGRFLAALMKKDLGNPVGIEFIAVGSGSSDEIEFKDRVKLFFNEKLNAGLNGPYWGPDNQWWVWAKEVKETSGGNIVYLNENDVEIEDDTITNKLKITVTTEESEPCEETLDFREFALLGIAKEEGDPPQFITDNMYLINYVRHGLITKDNTMEHTRTIKLSFPINDQETGG